MRLVYVLFDSLNRQALSCYGGKAIETPAFDRLAKRCVTFDNHYVGSLPCMPARRDLHTGRLNFLHRPWGPLEPFDNSFPQVLAEERKTYSHLVTDHYHYFEDGGVGFHGRYSSWDFVRGQEKDKWQGVVQPDVATLKQTYHKLSFDGETGPNSKLPYVLSRAVIKEEDDFPIAKCFDGGIRFLEGNRSVDNWVLHLECFDPHEPFFAAPRFREGLQTNYRGPILDWLPYGRFDLSGDEGDELRANYLALVKMCDYYLGKMLDYFDEHNLWEDTALVLSTDHGLLLGEHEYWGKNRPPFFNEVTHIPLFIHDPRRPAGGARRSALTQTTDLMPTVLELFGVTIPTEVRGKSLIPVIDDDTPVRMSCIYGQFGSAVNVTDGRYTYFRYPEGSQQQLYHYTLMPMHMRTFFEPIELNRATLFGPFDFTKGCRVLKLPVVAEARANMISRYPVLDPTTALYDLANDPKQIRSDRIAAVEKRMIELMIEEMRAHDAPVELYKRLGI